MTHMDVARIALALMLIISIAVFIGFIFVAIWGDTVFALKVMATCCVWIAIACIGIGITERI